MPFGKRTISGHGRRSILEPPGGGQLRAMRGAVRSQPVRKTFGSRPGGFRASGEGATPSHPAAEVTPSPPGKGRVRAFGREPVQATRRRARLLVIGQGAAPGATGGQETSRRRRGGDPEPPTRGRLTATRLGEIPGPWGSGQPEPWRVIGPRKVVERRKRR